ncbi:MAG: hypothetical protein QG656_784, partial [Candidatus Hydrogenedentes bacterium]|nr:hypothetical protein [Candidatus Hydrogenedentota bacterium]
MKYAFMTFSTPKLTLDENLALAKQLGYDGIEPRTVCGHAHGVELEASAADRKTMKEKAETSGVVLACVATSLTYADPVSAKTATEETLRYIDLAGDVGAPCIRVFGGAIPKDVSRERATAALVSAFRAVADHAALRGVTVCAETHDDWCNPDHLAEAMRQTDHPNIAVNWDIMHPIRQGGATMDSAFAALKPW